jgi:hypothetical protein
MFQNLYYFMVGLTLDFYQISVGAFAVDGVSAFPDVHILYFDFHGIEYFGCLGEPPISMSPERLSLY